MASELAIGMLEQFESLGQTEAVTYRPTGGDAVERQAIVKRLGVEEQMNSRAPAFEVSVVNDADYGIDATALDEGVDRIDVAEKIDGTAVSRAIQAITQQDTDWLTLRVQ